MKRIRVTYETARDALIAARDERGAGFMYDQMFDSDGEGCRYLARPRDAHFDDSPIPACLVGVALTTLDKAFEEWLDDDNEQAFDVIVRHEAGVENIVDDAEYHIEYCGDEFVFEGIAVRLLTLAQSSQDTGNTWGESVSYALDRIKR